MIVGEIDAYQHRGCLRIVIVANTGEVLGIDLDEADAAIFLWQLETAWVGPLSL